MAEPKVIVEHVMYCGEIVNVDDYPGRPAPLDGVGVQPVGKRYGDLNNLGWLTDKSCSGGVLGIASTHGM